MALNNFITTTQRRNALIAAPSVDVFDRVRDIANDTRWKCESGKKFYDLLMSRQAFTKRTAITRRQLLIKLYGSEYTTLMRHINQLSAPANPSDRTKLRLFQKQERLREMQAGANGAASSLSVRLKKEGAFLHSFPDQYGNPKYCIALCARSVNTCLHQAKQQAKNNRKNIRILTFLESRV